MKGMGDDGAMGTQVPKKFKLFFIQILYRLRFIMLQALFKSGTIRNDEVLRLICRASFQQE